MSKGRILIADDELTLTESMQRILSGNGYDVSICNEGTAVESALTERHPDVVLLDIFMGNTNGVDVLKRLKAIGCDAPVIMMTAHADVGIAVNAMKQGAWEFVVKPFDLSHLGVILENAIEYSRLQKRVKVLQDELERQRSSSGIICKSSQLGAVLETAQKYAQSDTTVLIEGASGTGKELISQFIHQKSARGEKQFVVFNCGAIPRDLAESEFFGYEKGAFTGATERMRQGKFEVADGGTIVLDEIGELSLDMQVKLLRVLEGKSFYRLGGIKEIFVDVRVIASTNRDLLKEVEAGRFREDLYYRLNIAMIRIPPLRERRDDIEPLIYSFLEEFRKKLNKPSLRISEETIRFLEGLPWKGNVRELKNALERVVLLSNVDDLTIDQFTFLHSSSTVPGGIDRTEHDQYVLKIPRKGVEMKEVLKDLILQTLDLTHGNQVQASKILGVTRSKFRYRMEQLGIEPVERRYKISA